MTASVRIAAFFLVTFLLSIPAQAQLDTIKYDVYNDVYDAKLFTVNEFAGEFAAYPNVRFTPTERCTVEGVMIAMGHTKFMPQTGNDSLYIAFFEDGTAPLIHVFNTFRHNLGSQGIPSPNVEINDPFGSTMREWVYVPLSPKPVIAPARDFIIGFKLASKQQIINGSTTWRGMTVAVQTNSPNYQRSRRYQMFADGSAANRYFSENSQSSLLVRAVVRYDANLPDVKPIGVDKVPDSPEAFELSVWPNPAQSIGNVQLTMGGRGYTDVVLYDALGRHVHTLYKGLLDAGTHTFTVNRSQFSADLGIGFYYVAALSGSHSQIRTLIMTE